jgi:hypothetical protein
MRARYVATHAPSATSNVGVFAPAVRSVGRYLQSAGVLSEQVPQGRLGNLPAGAQEVLLSLAGLRALITLIAFFGFSGAPEPLSRRLAYVRPYALG